MANPPQVDLALRQYLLVYALHFECPLCGKDWERGGGKEGFVKSAAQSHVCGCRSIALWNLGYVGCSVGVKLEKIEDVQDQDDWLPRWRRNTLALIRSRKKAGLTVTVPNG